MCKLRDMRHACIALAVCVLCLGCAGPLASPSNGLKPGLNYMQPIKWRMTYRYRVKDIVPNVPQTSRRGWALDETIPTVGKGTWEVWMAGPREGEELRGLKLVNASIKPTKVSTNKEGLTQYYFDLAPDGLLPKEMQFTVTWEFTTFERYAYWENMKFEPYDKSSDLYKQYTKLGEQFQVSKAMKKEITKLRADDPNDTFHTALNCYNYILNNFSYDFAQSYYVMYTGLEATTNSYRCWENKSGQCDEFANVMCAMLRNLDIPCRPVAGICHQPLDLKSLAKMSGISLPDDLLAEGMKLIPAGHAWVEFWVPNYGWIPADPTWGMYRDQQELPVVVDKMISRMGQHRKINFADYYFGKSDPYRIPYQKYWNIKLDPQPKTPDAKGSEVWFIGCTERRSGVRTATSGWEGIPGLGGG